MMTIEHALTRTEIVAGYFRSLRSSPRYLATILFYAIGLGVIVMVERGAFSRTLTPHDLAISVLAAVAFLLFLPMMLFVRAKTSSRSLTVSPEGISTQIGSIKGQVPWRKVNVISDTDRCVLVARTNGNAFFIPSRAFSDPEQQLEFVNATRAWMNAAKAT